MDQGHEVRSNVPNRVAFCFIWIDGLGWHTSTQASLESLQVFIALRRSVFLSDLLTCPVSFLNATHKVLPYCWHDSSEVYLMPNLQPFLLRCWCHAGKAKKKGSFSAHVPTLARVAQGREHSNIKKMWPGLRSRRRHHLRGFLQVVFFSCPQKPTQLVNTQWV